MKLCGFDVGLDKPFFLIAGPCVVESEQLQMDVAGQLKEMTGALGIPFVFKSSYDKANRSSGKTFRGPGMEKGLEILAKVKKTIGVPILTDVHTEEDVPTVAKIVDVLQTPAFLCRQTDFIHAVARAGKPVNIKKGQFLAPSDMKNVVDKAREASGARVRSGPRARGGRHRRLGHLHGDAPGSREGALRRTERMAPRKDARPPRHAEGPRRAGEETRVRRSDAVVLPGRSLMSGRLLLTAIALAASLPLAAADPPVAAKHPHETKIHGETLADDYYWLRDKGTPEVESYLKAERAYSDGFMQPTAALQTRLYDEMLSRIQQTDTNVPARNRGFFYYSRTEEGKQYPIFARRKGALDAPEEVILDMNALAEGKKFLSIVAMEPSPDGNLLAYLADDVGFRQYRLQVKDLRSGALLPDAAERVTSVEWTEDGKSLFYSVEHPQTKRPYQVFRHVLGAANDALVSAPRGRG